MAEEDSDDGGQVQGATHSAPLEKCQGNSATHWQSAELTQWQSALAEWHRQGAALPQWPESALAEWHRQEAALPQWPALYGVQETRYVYPDLELATSIGSASSGMRRGSDCGLTSQKTESDSKRWRTKPEGWFSRRHQFETPNGGSSNSIPNPKRTEFNRRKKEKKKMKAAASEKKQ
jgi:hypothetical protein